MIPARERLVGRSGDQTPRRRVALVTGFTLAMNPRVQKEAATLALAGHEVVVLGASLNHLALATDEALARDRGFTFQSVVPLGRNGRPRLWHSLRWRIRTRLANKLHEVTGRESRLQLGYFVPELWRATKTWQPDYTIVHLEQALWVGEQLLKAGHPVGIDLEDWYSEDLLPEARRHRPVRLLHRLEGQMLRAAGHGTCTSSAMSQALAAEFSCPPPLAIYNTFPWAERSRIDGRRADRGLKQRPSLHWFSQTIGPGRGLEELFSALALVEDDFEVHLRGQLSAENSAWLHRLIPVSRRDAVYVHGLVPNEVLLSRIAEHDIGFAGEIKYCRSRDLTVTNKLFQYLLGGLAVVASDTSGQREIAGAAPGAISLYESGQPASLASVLTGLLRSPAGLQKARAAALAAAQQRFSWEKSAPAFLAAVTRAIAGRDLGKDGTA
jgi:glycosyltransferase involved in cell wall biosynthesis